MLPLGAYGIMQPRRGTYNPSYALQQQRVAVNSAIDTPRLENWRIQTDETTYIHPYGKDMPDKVLGVEADEVIVSARRNPRQTEAAACNRRSIKGSSRDVYANEKQTELKANLMPCLSSLNGMPLLRRKLVGKSVEEQVFIVNSYFSTVGVAGTKCTFDENFRKFGHKNFAGEIGGVRSGPNNGTKPIRAGELFVWTAPPPTHPDLVDGYDENVKRNIKKRQFDQLRDGTESGKALFVVEPYDPMCIVSMESIQKVFTDGRGMPSVDDNSDVFLVETLVKDLVIFVDLVLQKQRGTDEYKVLDMKNDAYRIVQEIFSVDGPVKNMPSMGPESAAFRTRLMNIGSRILNDQSQINYHYRRRIMGTALSDALSGEQFDYQLGAHCL